MNVVQVIKKHLEELYSDAAGYYPDDDSKREGYKDGVADALKAVEFAMKDLSPGEDIVRVLRIYEFSGPRSAVEKQVAGSIHGEKEFCRGGATIKAVTLGLYPEIMHPQPPDDDD